MLVYERDYIRSMCTLFGADAFKLMRRKPEGIPYVPSADEMLDALTNHLGNAKQMDAAKHAKDWLEKHLPTEAMYAEAYERNEPSIVVMFSPNKEYCAKDAQYRRDVKYWRFAKHNTAEAQAAADFDKVAHALYAENGRGLFTLARTLKITPDRLDRAMQGYCWDNANASKYLGSVAESNMRRVIGPARSETFSHLCDELMQGRGLDELFAEKGIKEVQTLEDPAQGVYASVFGERVRRAVRHTMIAAGITGGALVAYRLGQAELPRQWVKQGVNTIEELRYRDDYARRHGSGERQAGVSIDVIPATDTTTTLDFTPRMLYPPVSSTKLENGEGWGKRMKRDDSPGPYQQR